MPLPTEALRVHINHLHHKAAQYHSKHLTDLPNISGFQTSINVTEEVWVLCVEVKVGRAVVSKEIKVSWSGEVVAHMDVCYRKIKEKIEEID